MPFVYVITIGEFRFTLKVVSHLTNSQLCINFMFANKADADISCNHHINETSISINLCVTVNQS